MKNPRQVIFPLLVLAIAAGLWLFQGFGPAVNIGETPGIELTEEERGGELMRDPSEPRTVVASSVGERKVEEIETFGESASYRAALGGLRGRVVREKGMTPIAGIEVIAIELRVDLVLPTIEQALELLDAPNPLSFRVRTRTDAEGRFVLEGVHPRAIHLLGIGLRTPDTSLRFVDNGPGKAQTSDLGDIVIETRGSLSGVLQDSVGQPIEGARVRALDIPQIAIQAGAGDFRPDGRVFVTFGDQAFVLSPPPWLAELDAMLPFTESVTGVDGSFRIEGVRPGAVTVLAQKLGYVPATQSTRIKPDAERNVGTVRFARPATLNLRFVDTNNQPVASARAAAGRLLAMAPFGFTDAPSKVSADGTLQLTGLTRGKLYAIWQREAGAPWKLEGPLNDGEQKTIVVPAALTGVVKVVDDKGQPISARLDMSVTYTLGGVSEQIPIPGLLPKITRDKIRALPDVVGAWAIEGLVPGTWNVRVRADGYAFGSGQLVVKEGAKAEATIALGEQCVASFVVVDPEGAPVEGARVYWNSRRGTPKEQQKNLPRSPIPVVLGKTDKAGSLVANGVPVGATRFAVRHPAFAVVEVKEPVQKGIPLRVQLGANGDLEGVVTERGSRPKEPINLILEPRVGGDLDPLVPPRFVRSDEVGAFVVRGLQPGKWRIQRAPPLRDLVSPNDLTQLMMLANSRSTRVDFEIEAGKATKLSYEVDSEMQRLAYTGALNISVRKNGQPLVGAKVRLVGPVDEVKVTDALGNASIEHLKDGDHWVTVHDKDTPMSVLWGSAFKIEGGARVDKAVDVRTGGIRVQVLEVTGAPLAGVNVQVQSDQGGWQGSMAITDENGVMTISELAEGEYRCQVNVRNDERAKMTVPVKKVMIRQGQVTNVELRAIRPAEVQGSVVLDVAGLSADQQKHALASKPQGGRFVSTSDDAGADWRSWTRLKDWNDATHEAALQQTGLAPGEYRFETWGGQVRWETALPIVVSGNAVNIRVVLRPTAASLEALQNRTKAASGESGR